MDRKVFNSIEVEFEEKGIVNLKYLGPSDSADFRKAWSYAFKVWTEFQNAAWLIDQKNESVFPEDHKWLEEEWFGWLLSFRESAGEMRVAIVKGEDVFSEFSIVKFAENNLSDTVQIRVFERRREAERWLEEILSGSSGEDEVRRAAG